jgi:PKD repeat protein
VTINTPRNFVFHKSDVVTFTANVTDDKTPVSQLQYAWEVRIIHNNHFHPDTIVGRGTTLANIHLGQVISYLERDSLEIYLTVTDSLGISSTDWVRARPVELTNKPPVAGLSLTPSNGGSSPFTLTANAGNTKDADMDFLYYTWDFGDGLKGTGEITRHTYNQPGTYTVTLSVEDPFSSRDTASAKIIVK